MKTCGIIGGMGPEATALFYMKLIRLFQNRQNVQGYPPVIIYSVPEPFQVADSLSAPGENTLKELTLNGLKAIQDQVDFCVIPCNTAHIHINSFRSAAKVPILSIIEETCRHLVNRKTKRAGLLATTTTIAANLYQREFAANNIEFILPAASRQKAIAQIIGRIILGKSDAADKRSLLREVESLHNAGAEYTLLACTELPILLSQGDTGCLLIDTLDILAEACLQYILAGDCSITQTAFKKYRSFA
jgi:aspartate racemase